MKFTVALSFLACVAASNPFAAKTRNTAKASYAAALLKNARRLDDQQAEVDVSSYAVKFEKCQFIKAYSDNLAEDKDSDTVLGVSRFVIFRLCPDTTCSTCSSNYGEYMTDLDSYLEATVEYAQQNEEEMCNACNECVEEDDAADADAAEGDGARKLVTAECSTCAEECAKIANMGQNGYIEATNFLGCVMVYQAEGDDETALYAGPVCASDGAKITIGVFTDQYCYYADDSKNVEDYVKDANGNSAQLSHGILKTTYSGTCISCAPEEEDDGKHQANELCQRLYEDAAKCEAVHGISSAFYDEEGFENQVAQETVVCDFIKSVSNGAYDSSGEISIYGGNTKAGSRSATTGGQKFALTFFILGTVGLAAYAAMLHTKLTKGGKAGLSNQGGAMA